LAVAASVFFASCQEHWGKAPVRLRVNRGLYRKSQGDIAMKTRLIAALAFSLVVGTAAFAQTNGGGTTQSGSGAAGGGPDSETGMPESWKGNIGNTFFSDSSGSTMRSESEWNSGWSSLSAEQQAQVRSDCEARQTTASTGMNGNNSKPQTFAGGKSDRTERSGMEAVCNWVSSRQ
jgi:hypothetical protein